MAVLQKVLIYIDGGSRGNPGPAACAAVLMSADDGQTLLDDSRYLGETTNNVAEYEGLLLGLQLAADFQAVEIEIRSDSELLVRQMAGEYRVRNAGLKRLHGRVMTALERFKGVEISHVRREQNAEADRLVNMALDQHLNGRKGRGPGKGSAGSGSTFRIK